MIEKGYDFDDVLLVPRVSDISSRDEVDISYCLPVNDFKIKFPLLASPMVGVTNGAFARSLSDLGGLAILHRFYEEEDALLKDIKENLKPDTKTGWGASTWVNDKELYKKILQYEPKILLIDTANGYTRRLHEYCEEVKNYITTNGYITALMAGNVVTRDGCEALVNAGCDLIRVGIGGGSICSTRNQTGVGIPNITALQNCMEIGAPVLVIDGGIRNPGDFVKAVGAGAVFGLSGKLFAQCYEAPNKGTLYGMASRTHMKNSNIEIKSVEGFDIEIKKQYSLEQFVKEFGYGIKSAGTYLGAKDLDEIYERAEFITVTDSAIKKGL